MQSNLLIILCSGPRFVVELGDKSLDYNPSFRLFLATRNPQPELPPDAFAILTSVNFTTTRAGLSGQVSNYSFVSFTRDDLKPFFWQILAATLQVEKPDLEIRRSQLLRQEEELKVQLLTLEDQLLVSLAESSGNILENKVTTTNKKYIQFY